MRRVALLIGVVVAAAACGLPTSSSEHIRPVGVPYGLLDSHPPTAATPGVGPVTQVFFVNGERMRPAPRRVVGLNVPAEALRALLRGPTDAESAVGTSSDIPPQTRLISLDLNGSTAIVDLSSDFGSAGGSQQVLAVAQIVYTLTASRFIQAVVFSLAGHRIEVPDGSGSLSPQPRTRDDYRSLTPHG